MTHPRAIWALALAILPWIALLANRAKKPTRANFAALFLLDPSRNRARRRTPILRALARSLLIIAIVLLWSDPFPLASDPKRLEIPETDPSAPLRVLIVDATPEDPNANANLSVADALRCALEDEPNYDLDTIDALEFALAPRNALENRDLVILADYDAPSNEEFDALEDFLRDPNRAAMLWTGANVDPQRWNLAFERFGINAQAREASFDDDPPGRSKRRRATALEKAFAETFPDFENAALDAPPLRRAIVCQGDDARPVVRDRDYDAPLASLLRDNFVWIAISPDPALGDVLALPAFPTFVDRVARFAAAAPRRAAREEDARRRRRALGNFALTALLALLALADAALEPRRYEDQANERKKFFPIFRPQAGKGA